MSTLDWKSPFNAKRYHSEHTMVSYIKKLTPLIRWQNIEKNTNVPDLYYSGVYHHSDGIEKTVFTGWVEAKYADHYLGDGSVVLERFTKGQRDWLIDYHQSGTNTRVLVGVGDDDLWLVHPDRFAGLGRNLRVKYKPSDDDIKIVSPFDLYFNLMKKGYV